MNGYFSALQFLMLVLFLTLGAFLVGIAFAPHVRNALVHLLEHNHYLFSILGFAALLIGAVFLFAFYFLQRHPYYQVELSQGKAEVDPELLREIVKRHGKKISNGSLNVVDLIVHSDRKWEIVAESLQTTAEEQEMLLHAIERDLAKSLARELGYEREFVLTVYVK